MISKPPRPGSMGATVPLPPPPSCSRKLRGRKRCGRHLHRDGCESRGAGRSTPCSINVAGRLDLSAAHGVAATRIQAAVGVKRRGVAHGRGRVSRKWVARIAWQYRDVVTLGLIEFDRAGVHSCSAAACRARERRAVRVGPAGAVAQVAHRGDVLPLGSAARAVIQHGLAAFAGERPRAALGYVIHVAGVEIRAKGGDGASGGHNSGAARARRDEAAVGGAVRVDPEGFVFFDNPAVVSDKRHWCRAAGAGQPGRGHK